MTVSFNTSLHPTATSLAADHAFCTDVMKKSGSSFAIPIALLPRSKRLATQSLYAFCRLADDLVDQRDSVDSASQAIDSLEQSLHAALAGKSVADPRVRALAAASHQYGIPREHLVAILDGVRMDLDARSIKPQSNLSTIVSTLPPRLDLLRFISGVFGHGRRSNRRDNVVLHFR